MTTRTKPLKASDQPKIFESWLKDAVELGTKPGTWTAISRDVYDAVVAVADEYPETNDSTVQKAKDAFAEFRSYTA
ncbi:hypothetical protein HWC80_gp009 [Mycobacterium phage Indlulamithi]|uniref:Uncharacterized protein n=1 Tax=Mycobacterium phage Indlulamithi TaxID=2656582 RepID=A0A649VCH1_9CAUD|nr:hypothetical protein HWC80_gp009 [Mycobacterium phage Indlulamithi]QGJ90050.1 hypothetical protein PBI_INDLULAMITHI_9 [Mycobacterium phage Indlulamithi]